MIFSDDAGVEVFPAGSVMNPTFCTDCGEAVQAVRQSVASEAHTYRAGARKRRKQGNDR